MISITLEKHTKYYKYTMGNHQLGFGVQGEFSQEVKFELFPKVMTREKQGILNRKIKSGTKYKTV